MATTYAPIVLAKEASRGWQLVAAFLWAVLLPLGPAVRAGLSTQQSDILSAIAQRKPIDQWPELSLRQRRQLHDKAEAYFIDYQKFHQPNGLTADILFSGYDRNEVAKLEGIGDSATWTGHYLAALAFRLAVT